MVRCVCVVCEWGDGDGGNAGPMSGKSSSMDCEVGVEENGVGKGVDDVGWGERDG